MKRRTYLKSIRAFCLDCMGKSSETVRDCPARHCKFYPYRFGKMPETKPDSTPLKSIRLYCLECIGTSDEVKGTAKKSSWACPEAELVKINLEKHLTDSK